MNIVKGETKTGFQFSIDRETFDNMELVDALAELEGGNPLAVSDAVRLLLGKEQRKKLYDHLREEGGRVPATKVTREITDIFSEFGKKGKN